MATRIAVIAGYFLLLFVIGFLARKGGRGSEHAYYLADRTLGRHCCCLR